MPAYLFKCKNPACGLDFTFYATISAYASRAGEPFTCPECATALGRRYTPLLIKPPSQGGYNHAVNGYVSGERDLREQLKAASEAAYKRTGIPADFKPVDLRDHEALGVTGEGLESTARAMHNEGRKLDLPKSLLS